ncbi:MAG: putative metal-binding motif-containing protein [Deltaproteobacteria bacterium]|nr:putative metal-binding motif-containing protein [Deltaproteobacteria bacterium]
MAPQSPRLGFAFAMVTLALTPDFRGCGNGGGGDEPLPTAPFEGCLIDADCEARMCADVRCLAGTCEVVDDLIDRDGDGDGPAAMGCGTDCDDFNPAVRPGVPERCNFVDDDCDGSIDESATGEEVAYPVMITSEVAALAAWDDASAERFVLFEATSSVVFMRTASLDGTIGEPTEVFRLDRGSEFDQLVALRSGTDVLLLARTDIGAVRWVVLRPGVPDAVAGPEFFEDLPGQVLDMEVAERDGGWWIAFDQQSFLDETERLRTVHDRPGGDPILTLDLRLEPPEDPLDVAALGTGYAVTFDGRVEIHGGGAPIVVTPAGALSRRPLANVDESLVIGFADAAGFLSLQRVMADGTPIGTPVPGPSVIDPTIASLRGFGEFLTIGAFADRGAAVWLRGPDLERVVGRESPVITDGVISTPHVGWGADALGVFAAGLTGSVVAYGIPCGP